MFELLYLGLERAVFVSVALLGVSTTLGLTLAFLQAATQIQEQSMSFVVKVSSVGAMLYCFGGIGADFVLSLVDECFEFIAHV